MRLRVAQYQFWFVSSNTTKEVYSLFSSIQIIVDAKNVISSVIVHTLSTFESALAAKQQCVSHCKYLGIMLDDELEWSAYIDLIYSKLVKFIFYKLRSKLPPYMMQKIYFAFVHPHILYGIELYANT
jgi:hypothetical protein